MPRTAGQLAVFALWPLLAPTCSAQSTARGVTVVEAFIAAVANLRDASGTRVVVYDVGANTGSWSESIIERLEHAAQGIGGLRALQPVYHMFEPQPRFAERLQKLARRSGIKFHAAAAWTSDTQLTFFESKNNEMASLRKSNAMRQGLTRSYTVNTVDLAQHIHRILTADLRPTLALLKLDVESAEFDILPALLARGVLCELSHVYVEWHLNALNASRRLSGVGLQLSLADSLRGCGRVDGGPEYAFERSYFDNNNRYVPVPGLDDEAERHKPPPKKAGLLSNFMNWKKVHKDLAGRSRNPNATSSIWR
mgnify:CR=1 FL=1